MNEESDVWTLQVPTPISREELSVALINALVTKFTLTVPPKADPYTRKNIDLDDICHALEAGPMTRRDLCRNFHKSVPVMGEYLATLVMDGRVTVTKHKPARGRPTAYYELVVADAAESV